MTVRYVGPGGSDGQDGLTWATRKLTLNGVEDTPVAATDIIYVGPGVYRETLTCDVSGASGQQINYIADVTGKNTDGIGGIVRLTGLDNDSDSETTRDTLISITSRSYRSFSNFIFDNWNGYCVDLTSGDSIFFFNCGILASQDNASPTNSQCFLSKDVSAVSTGVYMYRCWMIGANTSFVQPRSTGSDFSYTIDSCLYLWSKNYNDGFESLFPSALSQTSFISNCLFKGTTGFYSPTGHTLDNSIFMDGDLLTTTPGSWDGASYNNHSYSEHTVPGSTSKRWNMHLPLLVPGIKMPYRPFSFYNTNGLHPQLTTINSGYDMYGLTRPGVTKDTLGPFIWNTPTRRAFSKDGKGSIELEDQGYHWFTYPIALQRRFRLSAWTLRGADYAGTNPQFIIRRADKSDVTVTVSGSAGQWNKTLYNLDLDADDKFVQLFLQSNNTATSGDYYVLFSDIRVSE